MARTIIVALLGIGILMAMPSLLAAQGPAEEFPAAADITINGIDGGNRSGRSLASGDINNDGIPDLIIGARFAAPGGRNQAGETRVIFGPLSAGSLELSTAADITIRGIDPFDRSGFGVSSGDINDDGVTDLIIGAAFADPGLEPELRDQAGETYVIFGPLSAGTLELSTAADTTVNGIDPFDRSGIDVASGDINNDGAADLIIGGWFADPGLEPEVRDAAGETYVVFGPLSAGTLELGEPGGTVSGVVTDGTNPIAGMNVFASDFNTGDFLRYGITLPSGAVLQPTHRSSQPTCEQRHRPSHRRDQPHRRYERVCIGLQHGRLRKQRHHRCQRLLQHHPAFGLLPRPGLPGVLQPTGRPSQPAERVVPGVCNP